MPNLDLHEIVERLTRERDDLRRALEVIAVGDSKDPVTDAGDELVALGYWNAEAVTAMRAGKAGVRVDATDQPSEGRDA
jgi:predicted ABC-class ATPase